MTDPLSAQATAFYGQNFPTQRWTAMMTGDSHAVAGDKPVADKLARHIPVLARRAVGWLDVHAGGLYIDATFGAGGYTRAILETPGARVIGIDRDQSAVAAGAGRGGAGGGGRADH